MIANLKPTTARLAALLSTVAVSKGEVVLNGQAVVWIYHLADRRTVEVVVSRRGGRIVRATTIDGVGALVTIQGTATDIARRLKAFAASA